MAGKKAKVLRLFLGAALVVAVVAGCGDAAPRTSGAHRLPQALAQQWEGQASEIAAAADAGNDCRAMHLAVSLQAEVAASKHRLPLRLRAPLATAVDHLAARTSCTRVVTVPTPAPDKHKPPEHHHEPGHHKHEGGGDGKGHGK